MLADFKLLLCTAYILATMSRPEGTQQYNEVLFFPEGLIAQSAQLCRALVRSADTSCLLVVVCSPTPARSGGPSVRVHVHTKSTVKFLHDCE